MAGEWARVAGEWARVARPYRSWEMGAGGVLLYCGGWDEYFGDL